MPDTANSPSTAINAESINQALKKFADLGVAQARAAFSLGWGVGQIFDLLPDNGSADHSQDEPRDTPRGDAPPPAGPAAPPASPGNPAPHTDASDSMPQQGNSGAEVATVARTGPREPQQAGFPDLNRKWKEVESLLLDAYDLAPWAQLDVRRAEMKVALNELFSGSDDATSLIAQLSSVTKRSELAKLNTDFVIACTTLDTTFATRAASETSAPPPLSTRVVLVKAYEVGRLLSVANAEARHQSQPPSPAQPVKRHLPESEKFTKLFAPGNVLERAQVLLGDLHATVPAAAAYSACQHIQKWRLALHQVSDADRADAVDLLDQTYIWQALLSGQTPGTAYLHADSWPQAADSLLASNRWPAVVRRFWHTIIGKILFALLGLAILIYIAAFVLPQIFPKSSGTQSGTWLAALVTAAAAAAGIFHISRKTATSALGKGFEVVEPLLLEAEIQEAIAVATLRLTRDKDDPAATHRRSLATSPDVPPERPGGGAATTERRHSRRKKGDRNANPSGFRASGYRHAETGLGHK